MRGRLFGGHAFGRGQRSRVDVEFDKLIEKCFVNVRSVRPTVGKVFVINSGRSRVGEEIGKREVAYYPKSGHHNDYRHTQTNGLIEHALLLLAGLFLSRNARVANIIDYRDYAGNDYADEHENTVVFGLGHNDIPVKE